MTKQQVVGVESSIEELNYLLTEKNLTPFESTQIIQAVSSLIYAIHSRGGNDDSNHGTRAD